MKTGVPLVDGLREADEREARGDIIGAYKVLRYTIALMQQYEDLGMIQSSSVKRERSRLAKLAIQIADKAIIFCEAVNT